MAYAQKLVTGDEGEALSFLSHEPIKNIIPIGYIRDNGMESPRNRGSFYGCFERGRMVGLSLIGHTVVLDGNRSGDCRQKAAAFADAARHHSSEVRQVLGEEQQVKEFHLSLSRSLLSPPAAKTERQVLLSLKSCRSADDKGGAVALADLGVLEEVVVAHASAYEELCGVNPLERDARGFRDRVRARVERGRVWAARDEKGITFKSDVVSETEDAVYLEGVWARPDQRGCGFGTASLRRLCRLLLARSRAVCLFTEAGDPVRLAFFRRVGFTPVAAYDLLRYCH